MKTMLSLYQVLTNFKKFIFLQKIKSTTLHNGSWADWLAQAGSYRKEGMGKGMKLMQKTVIETCMPKIMSMSWRQLNGALGHSFY